MGKAGTPECSAQGLQSVQTATENGRLSSSIVARLVFGSEMNNTERVQLFTTAG